MTSEVTDGAHPGAPTDPTLAPAAPTSWSGSAAIYAGVAVCLAMVSTVGVIVLLPVAYVLVLGAVPYTVIATAVMLWKRHAARRELRDEPNLPVNPRLAAFGGRWQQLSLINGVVLGILGLLVLSYVLNIPGLGYTFASAIVVVPAIAATSVLEIVVNAGWIYPYATILAEEHALKNRTPGWVLIRVNRWLGWVIWLTGAGVAVFMIISQMTKPWL